MTTTDYIDGARKTSELLRRYEGKVKSKYFRPPYGQPTFGQYLRLKKEGYKIVLYSLMPGDFDFGISNEKCLSRLITGSRAGDIVVLHDNEKTFDRLVNILPQYLDYCLSSGFRFALLP